MRPVARFQAQKLSILLALIALLVLGSTAAVIFSALNELADQTNKIDRQLTAQASRAALRAMEQRVRDLNSEFAGLPPDTGPHPRASVFEQRITNLCDGTRLGANFNVFFLVSPSMRNLAACVDGERLTVDPATALGRAFAPIVRDVAATVNRNPVRSGYMLTNFGIAAVSVGPAWWSRADVGGGSPALLVIGRRLDRAAVERIEKDFAIRGLTEITDIQLVDQSAAIREPGGRVIGGLAWTPREPGSIALVEVQRKVLWNYAFLAFAFATMAGAVWLSFRAVHDSNRRTAHAAIHDPLTGLSNRAALIARLEDLSRSPDPDETSVIFLDLDGFKEVNDFYGHEMGDRLLQAFGAGLTALVGGKGLVARVGGDEFVVLLAGDTVQSNASRIATAALALSAEPLRIGSHNLKVAASVGIASSDLRDSSGEELLRRADIAMYEAKRRGGGAIAVYSREIDTEMKRRRTMAEDIQKGLGRGEFWIACQPIVEAANLSTVAMEVLARWTRADGTNIPPIDFIRVAEEHGLIDELGRFVLEEACKVARANSELLINVNISALQMRSLAFLDSVDDVLERYGVSPDQIQIEMTESKLLLDGAILASVIHGLKRRGIRIILDDFGTGYASIAYLRQFHFDGLKLDRSICSDVGKRPSALTMAQGMILVAKAAGLNVVAEGIENKEQASLLKLAGCTHFQGYLFGAPARLSETQPTKGRSLRA